MRTGLRMTTPPDRISPDSPTGSPVDAAAPASTPGGTPSASTGDTSVSGEPLDVAEHNDADRDAGDHAPPLLTRRDQLLIIVLCGLAVCGMSLYWLKLSHWGTAPVEIERLPSQEFRYAVDVNEATWIEFAQLEGIGDTLAQRIVADRESNGPFNSVDDLARVKGIGKKTLDKIRPWLAHGSASRARSH